MSTDAHGPSAGAHAPDAHHEVFTGEPVDVLPDDEPRTPGWLPLLGVALFTAAAVAFLVSRSPAPAPDAAKPAETAAPAPQAAAPAPQGVAPGAPRPPIEPFRQNNPGQVRRLDEVARPVGAQPTPPRPAPPPPPAGRHP